MYLDSEDKIAAVEMSAKKKSAKDMALELELDNARKIRKAVTEIMSKEYACKERVANAYQCLFLMSYEKKAASFVEFEEP